MFTTLKPSRYLKQSLYLHHSDKTHSRHTVDQTDNCQNILHETLSSNHTLKPTNETNQSFITVQVCTPNTEKKSPVVR